MTRVRGDFLHRNAEAAKDPHHVIRLNTGGSSVDELSQRLQLRVGDVRDNDAGLLLLVPEHVLQERRDAGEDQAVTLGGALRAVGQVASEGVRPTRL